MSIRDIVHKMPTTTSELSDYITKHYEHVNTALMNNPGYREDLEAAVQSTYDKYIGYVGGLKSKLSSAGHGVGYVADGWLLGTGDIVGTLGGKFLHLLAQVPEKSYSLLYGLRTGNYLDSAQNIAEGLISYLPEATFVDQGLDRIIRKRMVKDALLTFEKKVGMYQPWHKKLADKLSDVYTGVKDRSPNVFTPAYAK